MKTEKHSITIYDQRGKLTKLFGRLVSIFMLVVIPIGIGIVAGSSAMQWAGFIFASLIVTAVAVKDTKKFTSKADAIAFIESLKD